MASISIVFPTWRHEFGVALTGTETITVTESVNVEVPADSLDISTTYVVVFVGFTVIELEVFPLLQSQKSAPEAVNEILSP